MGEVIGRWYNDENDFVTQGPPRSRSQDGIKLSSMLPGETPVGDYGEEARKCRESQLTEMPV